MAYHGVLFSKAWVPPDNAADRDDSSGGFAQDILENAKVTMPDDLSLSLRHYERLLSQLNPAAFPFLTVEKKAAIEAELESYICFLAAGMQAELNYGRYSRLTGLEEKAKSCEKLLKALNKDKYDPPETEEKMRPVFAIAMVTWMSDQLHQAKMGKFQALSDILSPINERRLYWVWGGSLLQAVLDVFRQHVFNFELAQQETTAPAYSLGLLSWLIYYTTFLLDFSMLLKHTFQGPWMKDAEAKAEPDEWERAKKQWQLRKFSMLNDFVWATCNLVCFYWLVGSGFKGQTGDFVTLLLLCYDLSLTYWRYQEEKQAYKDSKEKLRNEWWRLEAEKEKPDVNQDLIQFQQESLEAGLAAEKREWHYKQLRHYNNLAAAVGFIFSFALLALPYIPLDPQVFTMLSLAGASACFIVTVIYDGIDAAIDIKQAKDSQADINKRLQEKYAAFREMEDGPEKKLLYLEIMDLQAENDYQQKMIRYTSINLARTLIIDSLTPLMVYTLSVFVPLTLLCTPAVAGFVILGFAFALTQLSKKFIDSQFLPAGAEKAVFDEKAYLAFEPPVPSEKESSGISTTYFFPPVSDDESCSDDAGERWLLENFNVC